MAKDNNNAKAAAALNAKVRANAEAQTKHAPKTSKSATVSVSNVSKSGRKLNEASYGDWAKEKGYSGTHVQWAQAQQGQAQQQAQEQAQQQAQAQPEQSKFTEEANESKQGKQEQQKQEQYKYTSEANQTEGENPYDAEADADFVDLFAKDEGKPAANGREAAEKAAQWKALGGTPMEKKAQARERLDQYETELGNLESQRLYQEQMGADEKTLAEYDRKIQELNGNIETEKALINTTDAERDDLLQRYTNAANAEDMMAGYATDSLSQIQAEDASAARKALEEQLKEKNRALGNDVYFGLADQAQSRDLFEGWAGERAAGTASAIGTGLEWLGTTAEDMARKEYDAEHGEGAFDKATEGKNTNRLGDAGRELYEAAQGWQGQAQSDWASGTEDMSETGKQIAGLGKTAADMTMDMVDNFILPGSGRVAMAGRVAGQGALTQGEREKNDVDSRIAKAALDGGSAFLSEYLLGGAEQVYGKSIVGKAIGNATANLPKGVQNTIKIFMNTEGAEEGLEYGLSYLGDKILGLDENAQFDFDELKQNVAVGYLMGVLFNGVAAGINYDGKKIRNAVDEGFDAAMSGMTPEEITKAATLQPNDDVKIEAGKQIEETAPIAEADVNAEVPAQGAEPQTAAEVPQGAEVTTNPEGVPAEVTAETNPEAAAETGNIQPPQNVPEGTGAVVPETGEVETDTAGILADTAQGQAEAETQTGPDVVDTLIGTTEQTEGQNAGTSPQGENATASGEAQQGTQGAPSAPGTGPERTSQFFENTLTKDEGTQVREPLTYLGKSDMDTLRGAMDRLSLNGEAEASALMASEMWNDEQVQTARIIRQSLFDDANKTGDFTAYDAWRKVSDEHHRVIARALRQVGINHQVSAESVAAMAHGLLDGVEQDIAERGTSNTAGKVSAEEVAQVRQQVDESIKEMSSIEAEEAQLKNSGMSEEEAFNQVKDKYLDAAQKIVAERNMGMLWDNMLGRNKALRAGKEDVTTSLRNMLAKKDAAYIRNYVRANVAGQAADVVYKGRPTVKQAASFVSSMQKLCQLFGSGTTLRNVEGNTIFGGIDWASNQAGGALADSFLSLFTGNRTRGLESGLLNRETRSHMMDAARSSVLEIAANMDMTDEGKYLSGTTAFSPYNPGTRFLARLNQTLSYALNTTDALAVGLNEASAGNAAMRVGAKSGMTEETAARIGKQEAEFRTFKDKNAVTEFLTVAQQWLDLFGFGGEVEKSKKGVPLQRKGGFGFGTAIQPYIGVPANIALKGVQYSPVGAVKGAVDAAKAISQSKNASKGSQAAQDAMVLQNKASGEIGRGLTGTALIIALKALFKKAKDEDKEFFHDWDLEADPDIKAQNRAEGKFGQQVNLSQLSRLARGEEGDSVQKGDRMVDISGIEPLNQFLTMASLMADDDNASTPEAYTNALLTGAEETLTDLPCLEAIGTFTDTFQNSKIYDTVVETDAEGNETETREVNKTKTAMNAAGAMAGSVASGFIPAPVRHVAQAKDEYQRDTSADTSSQRALNQLKLAIPGQLGRESLPVKTDAYGQEVRQGDTGTRLANTYLGNKYSQVDQSETSREVERIREATGIDLTPDRYGPKSYTFGSGKDKETIHLTNAESTDAKNQRGQDFDQAMQTLAQDPVYQLMDDDTKAAMGQAAMSYAKDGIKTEAAANHDVEYESKYADIRDLPDPVEILAADTGLKEAKKAENWDAVDSLLDVIRGNQGENGAVSEAGMDYLTGKDSKLNYYMYLGDKGVPTRRAKDFETDLKALYESEKRTADRSSDWIRVAGSGNYSPKEADAIMTYESKVSNETIARYQDQVRYNLGKAGIGNAYNQVWGMIEQVNDGDMDGDSFKAWVDKNIPLKQRQEIKDICSNYTSDRHVAGKQVTAFYEAARSIGCTPEQALQFFDHIDTNYNGSYTKGEIDAAVAWAFGYDSKYRKKYYGNTYTYYNFSGQAKKVRDYILEAAGK